MKTIYLDCGMGAAGDMLTAALLELLPDKDAFVEKLNDLQIPDVVFSAEKAVRAGITGTHMKVTVSGVEEGDEHAHDHDHGHEHTHEHESLFEHIHVHEHKHEEEHAHEHHHSGMHEIEDVVRRLDLPEKVKDDVMGVYGLIADAESLAHGRPVDEIHFHEVGTMDAVADVTAVCLLFYELAPEKILASPVRLGSGTVQCAHGELPVPAPATAHILKGVPVYAGDIKGEMCTPTGAALLKYFVTDFTELPVMTPEAIGYGMGKRDYPAANCVRAILGETADEGAEAEGTDTVLELSCNVDDMTGEEIGFAMERLFEGGAKEVFTLPAGMKKSRPGTLICVICDPKDKETMLQILFTHTTTIGVREAELRRNILDRTVETVETAYGPIRRKVSTGYGVTKMKYEYEDLSRAALEYGLSIREINEKLVQELKWEK